MYSLYKQTHPPTGVEHAIYCCFFSSSQKNLIVGTVNQLNVYRLNPEEESNPVVIPDKKSAFTSPKQKLECLANYSLFGNIMSMKSVTFAGAKRDMLLLSFLDAKISLVEYDPGTHGLKTLSLHYFEEQELREGLHDILSYPLVRVDPESRCATMLMYGNKLVVLPFRRDVVSDDPDTGTRSPILSSYIINLKKLDERITNVIDIQFLHGYFEPTIFILYEPLQTWAGRTAVRHDTCCIAAISLNIQEKVHPVIWSLTGLPHDCVGALPVPKPIGGILVLAVNSLIFLNQSVPPFAVALNSIAESCTTFPLKRQSNLHISLDSAQVCLISDDQLVLSLKGGELYVLSLVIDSMRSVRGFYFDKVASSVLTTCICTCDSGSLFLGSRLGNSLLLRYAEVKKADVRIAEPPTKRRREAETNGDLNTSDLDDLEVYGSGDMKSESTVASYAFEVCDSIPNIGPCGHMVMGEPAFLSEEFMNTRDDDLDLELVTTCGYAKNGGLSVLQRSVRPQVVTTFELPGCQDMWTVYGPDKDKDEKPKSGTEKLHDYLILSRADSTLILQTGVEMMELDNSGFSTQEKTVFAGNIGEDRYIIQVSPMGVRLLEGTTQVQHLPIDLGSPIVFCSLADPFAVVMSTSGQIMLFFLKDDLGSGCRLATLKPQLQMKSKILALCTYKDMGGMFTTKSDVEEDEEEVQPHDATFERSRLSIESKSFLFDGSTIEDEDEMLYGDSETSFNISMDKQSKQLSKKPAEKDQELTPTYWMVVACESGVLQIYTMPNFDLCYHVKNFPGGAKVLVDSGRDSASIESDRPDKTNLGDIPVVTELLVVGLGYKERRPYLLAMVDDDLFIYEAFPFTTGKSDNNLKIRFKKTQHNLILREKKLTRTRKKDTMDEEKEQKPLKCLQHFRDIGGYPGVFIKGKHPYWLFMTVKGIIRSHYMGIDGPVMSFVPFHNVNCPKGFVYFNNGGELRISVLPPHLVYDSPWPMRKVPLRCTVYYLSYHPESKTYGIITSALEYCDKVPKTTSEERELMVVERDERYVYPQSEKFALQLVSPVSWEIIPNTIVELQEWEHATNLATVMLRSEGTYSGLKGYLAFGTNYRYGEDVSVKGRIFIADVIQVVPEPGQPLTKNKLKVIYDKEQMGSVSCISHVNGFLVSAIGQKLYIWQLKDNDLHGVAFIDTFIYIHTIKTIKNLILIGDLLKSISLYRYQEDMKVLSVVSQDVKPLEVYSAEFLIENTALCFLVSDRLKNLVVFSYHPEARESHGGRRLLRKADFNVGSHINCMFRIQCRVTNQVLDKKTLSQFEQRHITYMATLDGGLSFLYPLNEKVYRRLLMLQNVLTTHIQHIAGLNPRSYRMVKHTFNDLSNPQKNILDGELLWKFTNLSLSEMNELSKRIGTTTDQLMDDLIDIDRSSLHF